MLINDNKPYLSQYNVIGLLKNLDGSTQYVKGKNLVVTTGTNYYAELINGDTPADTFTSCFLGNPASNDTIAATDNFSNWGQGTLTDSTEKSAASTGLDNQDIDNTGRGEFVYTWKFAWGGGDFNTDNAILDVRTGIISSTNASIAVPILNHFNFGTPFEKLSTSSLTLWVNHSLVGA